MEMPREVVAAKRDMKGPTQRQRILLYLFDEGEPRTTRDIAEACDIQMTSCHTMIAKMTADGDLKLRGYKLTKSYAYEGGMRQIRAKAYYINEAKEEELAEYATGNKYHRRPKQMLNGHAKKEPEPEAPDTPEAKVNPQKSVGKTLHNNERWYGKDDDLIRKHYEYHGPDWIAEQLGRTRAAVMARKSNLDAIERAKQEALESARREVMQIPEKQRGFFARLWYLFTGK